MTGRSSRVGACRRSASSRSWSRRAAWSGGRLRPGTTAGRDDRRGRAQRQEVQDLVLDGVARLSAAYGDAPVIVDQHLARVVRDGLRRRGVSQVIVAPWTATTRTEAFRAVRARLLADRISLPADEDLVRELCRVRSRLRSGQAAVEIPRTTTSHRDMAVALASALLRLEQRGVPRPGRTRSPFYAAPPRKGGHYRGVVWVPDASEMA